MVNRTSKDNLLSQVMKVAKKSFLYVALFSCLINILMLTAPLYMLQIYDRVLTSQSVNTLIFLTIIAIFALVILAIFDAVRTRILIHTSKWFDEKLSPEALKKCPDSILGGENYGGQSLTDIATLRGFLSGQPLLTLFDTPWIFIFLGVVFLLHWVLGVVATICAICLFVVAYANERHTRGPLNEANKQYIKNQQTLGSTLSNADAIQGMGMLDAITRKWTQDNQGVIDNQVDASIKSSNYLPTTKLIRFTAQVLILGLGAYLVILAQLTPGMMIAASIIMGRALAPIEQAVGTWKNIIQARQSYGRLKLYFNLESKRASGIQMPTPNGELSVEHVSYVPPGAEKPVVHNLTFGLAPGEILGIVGPSASGKSTLSKLIVGALLPNSGCVRLDGADVYHWNRSDFGKIVGFLPQEVELFAGTIAENIARMGPIDEQAVVEAATLSGAHNMILHMNKGYDTEILPGMRNLSGGQRQRIALARAFYGKPKLLVLDEPDANLDKDGEAALVEAINYAKSQGITTIVISHRPGIIEHVDKLLLMQEGQLQLFGPKEKALAYLRGENVETLQQKK